jgi:16S rRNA G527 N7-methylase RsmG
MNPQLEIHSVDSNQKKIAFQKHIKRTLGLNNLFPAAARIQDFCPKKESTAIFKAFSSIKNGAQSLNQTAPFKNLIFLKKDDEKTKEEITEASALLYDYKRHEYISNKEKMLVVELYDSKNSNN